MVEAFIPKWHMNFAVKALIPPIEDAFEDVSRLGEVGIRESSPKQKVSGILFKLLRAKRMNQAFAQAEVEENEPSLDQKLCSTQ